MFRKRQNWNLVNERNIQWNRGAKGTKGLKGLTKYGTNPKRDLIRNLFPFLPLRKYGTKSV